MSSTPLISCSIGAATVSDTVCAEAPGYCVVTTTVGGTTCGYSETGSVEYASAPTIRSTIDSTIARMGWLMERRPRFMTCHQPWHHSWHRPVLERETGRP